MNPKRSAIVRRNVMFFAVAVLLGCGCSDIEIVDSGSTDAAPPSDAAVVEAGACVANNCDAPHVCGVPVGAVGGCSEANGKFQLAACVPAIFNGCYCVFSRERPANPGDDTARAFCSDPRDAGQ